jgi:hypothetical protein
MKSANSTIRNFLPSISKGKKDSIALKVLYNPLLNYLLKRSILFNQQPIDAIHTFSTRTVSSYDTKFVRL